MAVITVEVDGQTHHESGQGDGLTLCGKPIPYDATSYWRGESTTNPCPKCFPTKVKKKD